MLPLREYNIRAHVLPGRWLTLYVMNAGGKALEWFHRVFCSEMSDREFFDGFLAGPSTSGLPARARCATCLS